MSEAEMKAKAAVEVLLDCLEEYERAREMVRVGQGEEALNLAVSHAAEKWNRVALARVEARKMFPVAAGVKA